MKVKDLIEKLQQFDGDANLKIDGYTNRGSYIELQIDDVVSVQEQYFRVAITGTEEE